MQNGTSRIFASVLASKVLPDPVGPMRRILLFSISTSANGSGWKAADESVGARRLHDPLEMVVNRDRKGFLRDVLPDDILVEGSADFRRFGDPNGRRLPPGVFVQFLVEDAFADIDATVANIDPGPAISLRTSAWLFPQKEHIVRLEARAIRAPAFKQLLFPEFTG